MAGTPKPIGRILIIPKGNYDPATPYNSLDLVRYDSKSWLCKTDGIIGITPTEGTDWTLMTEDGTDGTDGRGIVNIQRTGTDPSNPLVDIYTITYTDGTTSTFKVTNGSGGGTTADTMLKSVYDTNGDGIVDNANHAVNADNVGNSDTSLLEKLSDSSGKLNYNGNALMLEAAQFANQAKLGEFEVNQIGNNVKELALHSNITTKLSKVGEQILGVVSGDTATFTDARIGGSDIYLTDIYCSDSARYIKSQSVSGNVLTVTFDDSVASATCVAQLYKKGV